MKLASLKHLRDGKLIVVSRDLKHACQAQDIAPTLQAALDNWSDVYSALNDRYQKLNDQLVESFAFDPCACASPLPRSYHWADASAYVNHVELVRKARGAEMPASFWEDPLMYQGGSDSFLGPTDDIIVSDLGWGADFEAEVAIILDDVDMGLDVNDCRDHIKLLMLVNDVSLRNLIPQELAKGFGFYHSKPSSAFSPVAVTPDELGDAWVGGKVHLPLRVSLNGERVGEPNAGEDMTFNFDRLISHAAKTRALCAGTIIGSGTVSNRDRSRGSCCLAEVRMLELLEKGEAETDFLKYQDHVEIEMLDDHNHSIFGCISQKVSAQ